MATIDNEGESPAIETIHKSLNDSYTLCVPIGEIDAILKKLFKDGYIDYEENHPSQYDPEWRSILSVHHYFITFEGSLFHERGGYVQQEKDKLRERKNLNLINFCLAVGTALAGIYALVELIKLIVDSICYAQK